MHSQGCVFSMDGIFKLRDMTVVVLENILEIRDYK